MGRVVVEAVYSMINKDREKINKKIEKDKRGLEKLFGARLKLDTIEEVDQKGERVIRARFISE